MTEETPPKEGERLLEISNLRTYFHTHAGVVKAVQGVNYHLDKGETLGIVGESGSGKSVGALSIMRLVARPPGEYVSGKIMFRGIPVLNIEETVGTNGAVSRVDKSISDDRMRDIRGGDIAMIFQDPMTSLNPLLTVGRQIAEAVEEHMGLSRRAAYERAAEMLARVGIPSPRQRLGDYPFQFSGGMRQRVMIAIALSTNPDLLIADEPTTALDVTIQAQILDLMRDLSREFESSVILITHDLGVVAGMADRVAVMYAGYVVETGKLDDIFYRAQHPYTHMLLQSIPRMDQERGQPLKPIPGSPPDLLTLGPGCPFVPRCPNALPVCRQQMPPLDPVNPGHLAACWNPVKEEEAA